MYQRIIQSLITREIINETDADIYEYGLRCFVSYLINIFVSASISLFFGNIYILILFLTFFIPLRRFASGFHFNNSLLCLIFSQICMFLPQILISFLCSHMLMVAIMYIFCFLSLIILTIRKNIRIHKNRHTNESLKQKFRHKALIYEILQFFAFVIAMMMYNKILPATILCAAFIQLFSMLMPDV